MGVGEWLAVASGVALAASCGLRAFLPLLVLGIAARVGLVHPSPQTAWLGQDLALLALGVATVLELAADKIPMVDHALDAIGLVVRPVAAWVAGFALLGGWPSPWSQAIATLLALMALGVQGIKAKARLGSTGLTLGAGNSLLSTLEDAVALALAVVGLLAPLVVVAALIAFALFAGRRRAAIA
jgi:uncharacterized protein DUF4126